MSDWSSVVCSADLAVAHAAKDVHPRNRPGVDLARVGPDLAARGAVRESLADALDRGLIVAAIAGIIDELGLVDDAVDFLMLAHEAEEGAKPGMLGGEFVGRGLDDRGDIIPQLLTNIGDQDRKITRLHSSH